MNQLNEYSEGSKRHDRVTTGEQWDAQGWGSSGRYNKQQKNRAERRKAKLDPECQHSYGRYRGWAT